MANQIVDRLYARVSHIPSFSSKCEIQLGDKTNSTGWQEKHTVNRHYRMRLMLNLFYPISQQSVGRPRIISDANRVRFASWGAFLSNGLFLPMGEGKTHAVLAKTAAVC
jgi:hypothetical protein